MHISIINNANGLEFRPSRRLCRSRFCNLLDGNHPPKLELDEELFRFGTDHDPDELIGMGGDV